MEKRQDLHGVHGEHWVNRLRVGVGDLDSFAADSSLGHSCAGRSPLHPKTRSHTEVKEFFGVRKERKSPSGARGHIGADLSETKGLSHESGIAFDFNRANSCRRSWGQDQRFA